MDNSLYESFIKEYSVFLKEMAVESKRLRDAAEDPNETAWLDGHLMGMRQAMSLLQREADAYGIAHSAMGLADFDADRDLE